MGLVSAYQRWKSSFLPENRNVVWSVRTDESGFMLVRRSDAGEECTTFRWKDIIRVHGYKRDCFTVDQIRLVFTFDGGSAIEITEDDEGYKELLLELPKRLYGFPTQQEWWEKVAQPPFATNWIRLFQRVGEQ
jgi:hypothetical protein